MIRDLTKELLTIFQVTWEHFTSPIMTTRTERYLWTSGWAVSGLVALLFGPLAWCVVTSLTLIGWIAGYIYEDRKRQRSMRGRLDFPRKVDEEGIEPSRDEPTGA